MKRRGTEILLIILKQNFNVATLMDGVIRVISQIIDNQYAVRKEGPHGSSS